MITSRKEPAAVELWAKGGKTTAVRLTPEERSGSARRRATLERWADPEMRQRMIEGMKRAWSNPELRPHKIEVMQRTFTKPEVRTRRIEGRKRALRKPEVRQHLSEVMHRPEVLERIRQGVKASWTPERRAAQSRSSKKIWENRKAALKAAGQWPADWWKKPLKWRIIGDVLLSRDGCMSNQELGKALDTAQLIQCPYGNTWAAALSSDATAKSDAATALVTKIRRWVNKPGSSSRAKIAVNNFSQSA